MFFTETYELYDYPIYDLNGYSMTGTGSANTTITNGISFDNTKDWVFTCDLLATGKSCRFELVSPSEQRKYYIGFGYNSSNRLASYIGNATGGESSPSYSNSFDYDTYYTVRIVKQGTTIQWYWNDTLLRTDSTTAVDWLSNYDEFCVKLTTWSTNTVKIKNMKLEHI